MATQLDLAKEALAQIGTRSKITSLSDGSAEAAYLTLLYAPIRDFLLTEGDYDWSMTSIALVVTTLTTPWPFAYTYPSDALRIRQLIPMTFDAGNPLPIEWSVIGRGGARSICSNRAAGLVLYTSPVDESLWDPIFRQSFVRMLASALAFALENRIEASKAKIDEALGFAGIGKMRDI